MYVKYTDNWILDNGYTYRISYYVRQKCKCAMNSYSFTFTFLPNIIWWYEYFQQKKFCPKLKFNYHLSSRVVQKQKPDEETCRQNKTVVGSYIKLSISRSQKVFMAERYRDWRNKKGNTTDSKVAVRGSVFMAHPSYSYSTLQILYTSLYQYGVGPSFVFNTGAVLLGMDS
jgi:hypothetical protein